MSNLNEVQREEIITKCKESLRSRVSELESAFEAKDKQFVEMADKYMNEQNLRVTAETSSREAESKLEDMQNTLSIYQDKVLELETQLARHYEKNLTNTFCPEEGTSESVEETSEQSVNRETLDELKMKYIQECKNTLVLQDRIVELEHTLDMRVEEHEAYAEDAVKQQEWLASLLEKEREINENLSNESDLRSAELQKHLQDLTEQNSLLNKWKTENANNGQLLQELTENYRLTVNKLEIEKLEIHKELQKTRTDLNLMENERKYLEIPDNDDEDDSRKVDETKAQVPEQSAKADSSTDESNQSKKLTRHANPGYRARLSRMIQEGLQKFRNTK